MPGVASYDVDILADRKVVAIRAKFGASGSRAESLDVYQKLVVRRNVKTGRMSAYVMSLIPDVGCDDRCVPERFRSRGKDNGGFSGIAVYTTIDRGALVRVQEYKNGVLKRGVYIPSGEGSYLDRCIKAREILDGMALMSRRNIMDVDLETIAPSYVEADDPDEPKPYDDENENANDDGGDDENANGNEDDISEDDLPPGDEEMVALGREGVEKIAADLESGNVNVYQYLNGALTGLGVGANANGIITSAANFVREISSDHLFQAFGKSISAEGSRLYLYVGNVTLS